MHSARGAALQNYEFDNESFGVLLLLELCNFDLVKVLILE